MVRLARQIVASLLAVLFIAPHVLAETPKKLLLLGQDNDNHPRKSHEYTAAMRVIKKCLADVPGVKTTFVSADEPWVEGPQRLADADGVVIFLSEGAKWMNEEPRRLEALGKLAARGGGVVGLHWGMGTRDAANIKACLALLGGCHGGPDRKYKVLETDVRVADRKHPITIGIDDFRIREEFYYKLKFAKPTGSIRPLLKADIDGAAETVAWSWERPDGGRSFGYSGLHFHDAWARTECRRLVAQGILWTLNIPIPDKGLPVKVTAADLRLNLE